MRERRRTLRVSISPRLYSGDEFVASEGRIRLLELVDEHGSLRSAASAIGMSYRHAWGMLRKMEQAYGRRLVASERGGPTGGGSGLTEDARSLVSLFRSRESALKRIAEHGPPPALTVDVVVLRNGEVLLVERKKPPCQGMLALPGGFVDHGEQVEDAALREVNEETGLEVVLDGLVGVFSDPARDPRGTVSVAFVGHAVGGVLRGGDDAVSACFVPLEEAKGLAFDHDSILSAALMFTGAQKVKID